jgi:hypothetical protein
MDLETYLPQIDLSTERFRGNLMQGGIKLNVELGKAPADNSTIIQGLGIYDIQKDITGTNGATGGGPSNP